jgi:membrane-associated phospholipid phosphatase
VPSYVRRMVRARDSFSDRFTSVLGVGHVRELDLKAGKPVAAFVGQMAVVSILYVAYLLARGLIAQYIDAQAATGRGLELAETERQLYIAVEKPLQLLAREVPFGIPAANAFYIWGNLPLLAAVLVLLYFLSPRSFHVLRNSLVVSGAISVLLFAVMPEAPPRLIPGLGLADTLGGPNHVSFLPQPAVFTDRFAAMPSMHAGWALLAGLTLYLALRRSKWRLVGLVLPVAMAITVTTTGNHYVLDCIVGWVVAGSAFWLALLWQRRDLGGRPLRPSSRLHVGRLG